MSRRPDARLLSLALLALLAACEDKRAAPAAIGPAPTSIASSRGAAPLDAANTNDASPALTTATDGGEDASSAGDKPRWAFDCDDDTSTPKAGKSIGHTSVVFKIELSSGKRAAWKPNAKKVKERYRSEVAAYRLAQALGIPNVPPACVRAFDAQTAASALAASEEATKLFADEVIVEHGKVYGAVIPWIDGLSFWPLEKEPLRTEARTWLTAGKDIPRAKVELARQASMLVGFDFLTGNWDRYSGANVGLDRTGALVLFIDNDAAFMDLAPKERVARNKTLLEAIDRFPRGFIASVRALDDARLRAAFGEEAPGRPLLPKTTVATVARRAKELVAVVDAKISARGEAETLYFP